MTSESASLPFLAADAVRTMLRIIEATGADGEEPYSDLRGALMRASTGRCSAAVSGESADTKASSGAAPGSPPLFGQIAVERGLTTDEDVSEALARQLCGDARRIGEILVAEGRLNRRPPSRW